MHQNNLSWHFAGTTVMKCVLTYFGHAESKQISSQFFLALERSENCNLINWVINNGSINTRLHPRALLMLLDKHMGAY